MSTDDAAMLDGWLTEVRAELDDVPTPPPAGLADVFARAQRIDPSLVLPIDEAERLDAIDDDALDRVASIGSLDTLIAGARAVLGAEADAMERRGAPLPSVVVPARSGRSRWIATAAIVGAMAAGLVLAIVAWRGDRLDDGTSREYSGANQTATVQESEQAASREVIEARPRVIAPAPAVPEVVVEPEPEVVVEPAPEVPTVRTPRPVASVDDRLAALDAEARAAWARGDRSGAQAAFESMVRIGGTRAIVDLAFGDLFELARQRGDSAAETKLWARYVRRFPSGRYVDEARAGLCRRAEGEAKAQCWRAYLEDRPRGTYRDQARAALGDDGK